MPEKITRATQEYLDTLDEVAFGSATPVKSKTISPSDPAARFTGANRDRAFFAYGTTYPADLDNAVIVDVPAPAPVCQAEVGAVLAEANEYTCPGEKKLKKYWRTMTKERTGLCKDGTYRSHAGKTEVSVRWTSPFDQVDDLKFHGSRSSMPLCG